MIIGEDDSNIKRLLDDSKYEFFLGGSRRMAAKHPESIIIDSNTDTDLYATHSLEIEDFLFNIGFTYSKTQRDYMDSECVSILKYGESIQIVLRKDAIFYREVFEAIDLEYYVKYLWKSSPTVALPMVEHIKDHFNALFRLGRKLYNNS